MYFCVFIVCVAIPQDRIQLSQVVTTLTDAQSKDTLIEPEYYQYLLLLLLKVGKVSSKYNVGTISKAVASVTILLRVLLVSYGNYFCYVNSNNALYM